MYIYIYIDPSSFNTIKYPPVSKFEKMPLEKRIFAKLHYSPRRELAHEILLFFRIRDGETELDQLKFKPGAAQRCTQDTNWRGQTSSLYYLWTSRHWENSYVGRGCPAGIWRFAAGHIFQTKSSTVLENLSFFFINKVLLAQVKCMVMLPIE